MNENLDLTKILKNCPEGTKLFCTEYGYVDFVGIDKKDSIYPITIKSKDDLIRFLTKDGYFYSSEIRDKYAEPSLFPAHDQRDWSKFVLPKTKVKVTLRPFDKVLVRDGKDRPWTPRLFTYLENDSIPYGCMEIYFRYCIPYNKDTARLLYTKDDCPIDYDIEFKKEFKEE